MSTRLPVLLLTASLALVPPMTAHADPGRRIVNRIAAVVGDAVITLRDVDRRLAVAAHTIPAGPPGDAAAARERDRKLASLRVAVLDELIDAELIAREAERRRIPVEPSDVDLALAEIAKGNGLTVPQILAEAAKIGMDETEYRAELRRQILALRTAQLWMGDESSRGELSPTAAGDLDAGRKRMLAALRQRAYVEVRK